MSFDSMTERDNITARAKELAGGRVFRGGVPDDAEIPVDTQGRALPYLVILFGQPTPTARDRGAGVGEDRQPHIFPWTIAAMGGDSDSVERLGGAVMRKFLNWQPGGDNSTPAKAAGGYSYTRKEAEKRPARYEETKRFTSVINLSGV